MIVDIKKAVAETMPKLTKINDTSTIELPKQKMMNISESHKLNSARKAAHKNRQKRINVCYKFIIGLKKLDSARFLCL